MMFDDGRKLMKQCHDVIAGTDWESVVYPVYDKKIEKRLNEMLESLK